MERCLAVGRKECEEISMRNEPVQADEDEP
jgi:hypothetical protein